MPDESWHPLVPLAERCAVRIETSYGDFRGSGFFVSQYLVLTCAHVVHGWPSDEILVLSSGAAPNHVHDMQLVPREHGGGRNYQEPDLALLTVERPAGDQVVWLSARTPPAWTRAIATGFSRATPADDVAADTVTFEVVGSSAPPLLKVRGSRIPDGMSGSLALDVESGRVCGLVKAADDERDLAGWIVPSEVILATFPELAASNAAEHPRGSPWWHLATRRAEFTQRIFGAADPVAVPTPPSDPPPSWWLNPQNQVVAFHPRPELDALTAWAKDDSLNAKMVRLLCGPGGVGKTRLALELAGRLHREGWIAGVLRLDDPAEFGRLAEVVPEAARYEHRVLLALDYIEGYGTEIARLAGAVPPESVRILLLARSTPAWWNWFSPGGEARYRVERNPLTIGPIAPDPGTTVSPFESALYEFRRRVHGVDRPVPIPHDLAARALRLGDVLKVHALALVAALHERDHGTLPDSSTTWRDPLDELLRHEGKHLIRSGRRLGFDDDARLVGQVLLAPNLFAARNADQARDAIARLPTMAGRLPEPFANLLRELYPPSTTSLRWWGGLPLDRLAETLLAQVIREAVDGTAYLTALFRSAAIWQAVEGLVLIVRVCSDEAVAEPIRRQIHRSMDEVVRAEDFVLLGALHVAETRVHGEAPRAARYATQLDGPQTVSLVQHMRDSGRRGLREFALVLLDHLSRVVRDSQTDRSLLDSIRGGQRMESESPMLVVIRAQILVMLDRYSEALRLTEDVINDLRPDVALRAEHDIQPSTSVIRIFNHDGDLRASESSGDKSEALAMALQIHAHALEGDERDDEALAARIEAIAVARRAADRNPDLIPSLTTYIIELAGRYIDRGENDHAEPWLTEALSLIRSRSDNDAIVLLTALARLRDRQGSHDKAAVLLAEVRRRRPGSDEVPEVVAEHFLHPAVSSAVLRAMGLAEEGRLSDAREAARAAFEQLRELAEDDPQTYASHLAGFLVWATDLEETLDQKLQLAAEAVQALRNHPGAPGPPEMHFLALALLQVSFALEPKSRLGEALDAAREAVQLLDRFAEHAPHKATPRLATALEHLSRVAFRAGQPDVALEASRRLANLIDEYTTDPRVARLSATDSYRFHLVGALYGSARQALDRGQPAEAHNLLQEAFTTARQFLSRDVSDHDAAAMATRVMGIGGGFHQTGDASRAVAAFDEAIAAARGDGAVDTLVLAHWGRVFVLNEFAPFPTIVEATQALLPVCRLPGVDNVGTEYRQGPRWALDLAHRPEARTHPSATVELLTDVIRPPADTQTVHMGLLRIAELIRDTQVPESLARLLAATLPHPTEPVAVGLVTMIAAELPVGSCPALVEALAEAVMAWNPAVRDAHWRTSAPTLLLHAENLLAVGELDEAIPVLTALIDLLRPHAGDGADLLALAIRRLIVACRDTGRLSDVTDILVDRGPEVIAAITKEAGNRADELAADAAAAQERGDLPAAVDLAAQELPESYVSGDVVRIHRGHLDYTHARMRCEPFDPACLAHLVAAGIYCAFIGEPFQVGLAATLLSMQAGWHDIGTIAQLARRVDQTAGVSFGTAIRLAISPEAAQATLDEVLRQTVTNRRSQVPGLAVARMQWDPYIAALIQARRGDHLAERTLRSLLRLHADGSWRGLAEALLLVMDGQEHRAHDSAEDSVDEALIGRCINALRGIIPISSELATAAPIGGLLSKVLSAMQHGGPPPYELDAMFIQIEQSGEWDGLITRLRALIAGERDPNIACSAPARVAAIVEMLLNAKPAGGTW